MTIGSRRELRRGAVRWLRVAALVVVALVALRVATPPRPLVSIAIGSSTAAEPVSLATSEVPAADDVVEVRKVRRARPVDPALLAPFAVFLGIALLAAAALVRRHDLRIADHFASRAVPVLGGRAPPVFVS